MKTNIVFRIILAGLCVALLAPPPVVAQARAVSAAGPQPVRVTNYTGTVWGLALGVEAGGRVHMLWTGERASDENFTAFYASSADGTSWSGYQVLDTSNAFDPQIVVDEAHGRVHLMYRSNSTGIMHRVITSGGMSAAVSLDATGVMQPNLAVDTASGNAYAIWLKYNAAYTAMRPYYAYWNGTSWSAPVQVIGTDQNCTALPGVAAAPGGGVMLAWLENCATFSGDIKTAFAADGIHFGAAVRANADYDWPETDDSVTLAYAVYDAKFHLLTDHKIAPGQSDIYQYVWNGTGWTGPQNVTAGSSPYWSVREFIGSTSGLQALQFTWAESGENVDGIYGRLEVGQALLPIQNLGYPFTQAGVLRSLHRCFLGADGALHIAVGEAQYDNSRGLYYLHQAPPALEQQTITPAGGTFTSSDGSTSLVFPAGAFTDTVKLLFTPLARRDTPVTGDLVGIDHSFDVSAVYVSTGLPAELAPGKSFPVTVDYASSGAAIPATLDLWGWDGTGGAWSQTGITGGVDVGAHKVTAQVDHLGIFAVLGETRHIFLPLVQR